jgi:hypothetical protein
MVWDIAYILLLSALLLALCQYSIRKRLTS